MIYNNKDVPPETIIRYLSREKGELKSEIDELKYTIAQKNKELKQRDKAIADFKKWQARVAEYHWRYWLAEALKLTDELPDAEVLFEMKRVLNQYDKFNKYFQKAQSAYDNINIYSRNLKMALAEVEKVENNK